MKHIDLHDYEITLLTKEEYEEHRERIPQINTWWWLRSPGLNSSLAADVFDDGSVSDYGNSVRRDAYGIRPALKSEFLNLPIGKKFGAFCNRWVMIDEGFAISEDVITHRRYDVRINVWETSELKAWLENWAKEGET